MEHLKEKRPEEPLATVSKCLAQEPELRVQLGQSGFPFSSCHQLLTEVCFWDVLLLQLSEGRFVKRQTSCSQNTKQAVCLLHRGKIPPLSTTV